MLFLLALHCFIFAYRSPGRGRGGDVPSPLSLPPTAAAAGTLLPGAHLSHGHPAIPRRRDAEVPASAPVLPALPALPPPFISGTGAAMGSGCLSGLGLRPLSLVNWLWQGIIKKNSGCTGSLEEPVLTREGPRKEAFK